jgi:sulfur carrier protein ThiS
MKIRLKLIAVEAAGLPPPDSDGLATMQIADGSTVRQALQSLGLPDDGTYLTLVNGDSVPVATRNERCLRQGDLLTVFRPIKGG